MVMFYSHLSCSPKKGDQRTVPRGKPMKICLRKFSYVFPFGYPFRIKEASPRCFVGTGVPDGPQLPRLLYYRDESAYQRISNSFNKSFISTICGNNTREVPTSRGRDCLRYRNRLHRGRFPRTSLRRGRAFFRTLCESRSG